MSECQKNFDGSSGMMEVEGASHVAEVHSRKATLSPFLIGQMFLREASWKYSAKLVGS